MIQRIFASSSLATAHCVSFFFGNCRILYFHWLFKLAFLVSKGLLCLYDEQNNTWLLLNMEFLFSCSTRAIELNTRRVIWNLRALIYYSPYNKIFTLSGWWRDSSFLSFTRKMSISIGKTKLSCDTAQRRGTTISLKTFYLHSSLNCYHFVLPGRSAASKYKENPLSRLVKLSRDSNFITTLFPVTKMVSPVALPQ